jgi:hypothetical protein
MFGLFGKKSDHPLADIKSAQKLLDDLPRNDALKSMQELASWLEAVREHADFPLDHEAEVLRLLDEAARPFERKLVRDYYAASSLPAFQENRLWMALNEFYTQLAAAYLSVLARYRNGEKGSSAVKPSLPLISARGIRALAGRLKCAAARYALVDPAIWAGLAEFYAHADAQRYLDEPVLLYPGAAANTAVRCEFTGTLIWYASSASTLNRFHMHLAERLTAHLCKHMTIGLQCGAGSVYGFDLLRPAAPMRVSEETTLQPGLLFIGVGNVRNHIEALLKTLEMNAVPEELNLGGLHDAEVVRGVLLHLAEGLTVPPPMRRNVRHKIKVSLNVANGFSSVMEQTGKGLNFGEDSSVTWDVEDISTGGFRCVVPPAYTTGITIGSLIGLKPEKLDRWGVGIVRRLSRDPQNNLHVGVEILSNRVTGVGLREQRMEEEQPALWLDGSSGEPGEARLLLSPDTYSTHRSLHAVLEGKNYLLMPLALLEKGEDYDLALYRKIEEDTGGE